MCIINQLTLELKIKLITFILKWRDDMKKFVITEELVQAIGNYLLQKPMAEVRLLVEALEKQLVLIEEKKEE